MASKVRAAEEAHGKLDARQRPKAIGIGHIGTRYRILEPSWPVRTKINPSFLLLFLSIFCALFSALHPDFAEVLQDTKRMTFVSHPSWKARWRPKHLRLSLVEKL